MANKSLTPCHWCHGTGERVLYLNHPPMPCNRCHGFKYDEKIPSDRVSLSKALSISNSKLLRRATADV